MIKSKKNHLTFASASDPGVSGKQNEDRHKVTSFLAGDKHKIPSVLAVLCDGIGGHRSGEVAAQMAVDIISDYIVESDIQYPLNSMQKAVSLANDAIYQASQTDSDHNGMGTTCAIAWVIGENLYTANLGDSRIYLLRQNHILQLTTDHTWLQEALDAGRTPDDISIDTPNAHVIRRFLGSKRSPHPDFRLWLYEDEQDEDALENQGVLLEPGDILIVCSDGLTDLLSDEEIRVVVQDGPIAQIPEELIRIANQRGGYDNITVILMHVPQKQRGILRSRNFHPWGKGCLIALVCISIILGTALISLRLWKDRSDKLISVTPGLTELFPSATPEFITNTHTPQPSYTPTDLNNENNSQLDSTITPWPTNTLVP